MLYGLTEYMISISNEGWLFNDKCDYIWQNNSFDLCHILEMAYIFDDIVLLDMLFQS
jgi:hypothetical protein